MTERTCTQCAELRPFPEGFAKDARKPEGRRYVCKICDRKASRDRRAGMTPKPGALALVLAPSFPAPPADSAPSAHDVNEQTPSPGGVGNQSFAEAAEAFIAALVPPADDADALLVRSLRGLADLADRYYYGADVVKDVNSLVASMTRVQRELAATRSARAKAPAEEKPAPRSAANY